MGWQSFCFWSEIAPQTNQSVPRTFQWMVIWYSAATRSVGWWKNFSFNMPLSSGGFLLICLRLVWGQFYCIMETSTLQYLLLMQFTSKKPVPTFKVCWKKKKIWRPPVEHLCWPEGCGIADWAGRRLYKVLLLPLWMGQLTEGQALLWKAMATPRRNDSRSEECITSSFRGQDENIFNSSSLKTWIN